MEIGNYKVIKKIGEGGFGYTYKAEHKYLQTLACLKQNIQINDTHTKLLREEAALLWGINHHSLPSIKDFFPIEDGSSILVMDYIPGKNVEDIVEKYNAIEPEAVCWIAQRTLQALQYLHHYGIIHGDVKPANIIVQPKIHNAILVDYGLACNRPHAKSKATGFTQAYAAPELLNGSPPIPESDLYGLGLTMLRAMGGDALKKEFAKNTPSRIRDFCEELLTYDPTHRPNWEKEDLVKRLSDIRYKTFGRRHSRK